MGRRRQALPSCVGHPRQADDARSCRIGKADMGFDALRRVAYNSGHNLETIPSAQVARSESGLMANKKNKTPRRVPRSTTPRTFGDGLPPQVHQAVAHSNGQTVAEAPVVAKAPTSMRRPPRAGEARAQLPLTTEYAYVMSDLRRLGILAATMFAILVVLGFVVQ